MKKRARSKKTWLIRWGSVALLVASLVTAACEEPAVPTQAPRDPSLVTAKDAYRTAVGVAVAWRSDARLVSVSASWHAPEPNVFATGRTSWAFYFASPSASAAGQTATYIVSVAEGRAEGIRESQTAGTFRTLAYLDWKVDSPKALDAFLTNGGLDFLRRHQNADVQARLYVPAEGANPLWLVAALDREARTSTEVRVDATSGSVQTGNA